MSRGEPGPGERFITEMQIQLGGVVQACYQLLKRLRSEDHLSPGVWGQPDQNSEIPFKNQTDPNEYNLSSNTN